jgi:hypothetical protein
MPIKFNLYEDSGCFIEFKETNKSNPFSYFIMENKLFLCYYERIQSFYVWCFRNILRFSICLQEVIILLSSYRINGILTGKMGINVNKKLIIFKSVIIFQVLPWMGFYTRWKTYQNLLYHKNFIVFTINFFIL